MLQPLENPYRYQFSTSIQSIHSVNAGEGSLGEALQSFKYNSICKEI